MALKTMVQKINEAREAYQKAKTEAGENFKTHTSQAISAAMQELPEQYVRVTWTQYTPYFNDGDACEFGVNEAYLQTEENEDTYDGVDLASTDRYAPKELKDVLGPLVEAWGAIRQDDGLLREAFGDHAQIVVHRDGRVVVESYDHD